MTGLSLRPIYIKTTTSNNGILGIYISTVYVYAELYCKHNYTPKRRKRGPETKIDLTPYIPYMMDVIAEHADYTLAQILKLLK